MVLNLLKIIKMKLKENIKTIWNNIDDKKLEEWTIKSNNALLLIAFVLIIIGFIINAVRVVFDF